MARYRELKEGKSKGANKQIYTVKLLDDTPQSILTVYQSRAYERLDNVAYKFYKNPNLWTVIARANNIANGTFHAKPGQKLIIPVL
ncbi:MAG: hypothetical protein VW683_01550 [Betaproteobacteria bacterium]|jgi:nucleoid-associated protein YgaU